MSQLNSGVLHLGPKDRSARERKLFGLAARCRFLGGALILGTSASGSVGCGEASDPSGQQARVLAPLLELTPTAASRDTFEGHRPAEITCNNVGGWYLEDGNLEVDTGECNYLSLTEPAAIDLPAGARIETEISYFDLTAAAPSEAHIALIIAGETIWEETIPIPSDARVIELAVDLPRAVQAGDPVEFHLHNHGQNSWNFTPILAP